MTRTTTRSYVLAGLTATVVLLSALDSTAAGETADTPVVLTGVTAIAAGGEHSCALTDGGRVLCWGAGRLGQLGTGAKADSPVAVEVSGIEDAISLAAGEGTSCALIEGGQVWCWGWNANGELVGLPSPGDEPATDVLLPVEIPDLRGATALVMRGDDPCALLADGTLRCRRSMWEVWAGRTGEVSPTPGLIDEAGLSDPLAVAAEGRHMCALMGDGTVGCWGHLHDGSLGDGVTQESRVPIVVSGVEGVSAIAMDQGRTCVVVAGGYVECWGISHWGEDGEAVVDLPTVEVAGVVGAAQLSMRGGHACALLADRSVRCWGSNDSGELGDGTREDSALPVDVTGLKDVVSVAAGGAHSCALTSAGEVRCWGADDMGQLGDGPAIPTLSTVLTGPDEPGP